MKRFDKIRSSSALIFGLLMGIGLVFSVFSLSLVPPVYTESLCLPGLILKNPETFCLNTLPILLMLAFVWLVTGQAWLSCLLTGTVAFLLSGAQYFKILFRDDAVVFADLLRVREATQMAKQYHVVLTPLMWVWIVAIVGLTVLLVFAGRGRPPFQPRLLLLGATVLLGVLYFYDLALNEAVYQGLDDPDKAEIRTETEAFLVRGSLYPFFFSAREAFDLPPDWYNPGAAQALLEEYPPIPQEKQVSLVSIQLEAFADFSGYGIRGLSPKVYADYHALEQESYTGTLITDVFAGGTAETEWAVLTGGNQHGAFSKPTNSAAWYLKSLGYTATGAHPSHNWFYNRVEVNPNLGLDNYRFMENYFSQFTEPGEDVAYDDVFFLQLEEQLTGYFGTSDAPLFSFNVTYQGHGPYNSERTWWGSDYCTGDYSTATQNILNNYFHVIQDTGERLRALTEFLETLEEPVVLVAYGDHKPWLGNGNSVYQELSINLETATREGFENYYSTQYLIWANSAAKEALGMPFVGSGPDLSPCFLMNEVFNQCGWQGSSYLQAQGEIAREIPIIHTTGWYEENGKLTRQLTQQGQTLVDSFQNLSCYDRLNFSYAAVR